MVINSNWVIPRKLDNREKEILFITLESAGYQVYHKTRSYKDDVVRYPYIGNNESSPRWHICSYSRLVEGVPIVTYEEVMEQLHKEIKSYKQCEETG